LESRNDEACNGIFKFFVSEVGKRRWGDEERGRQGDKATRRY
jgi:hypothetical protein